MKDTYLVSFPSETIFRFQNLIIIMVRNKINQVADSLRDISEEFGVYELGVFHVKPRTEESQSFLLISLDKSDKRASNVYGEWRNKWSNTLDKKREESIEYGGDTVVIEYRIM